MMDIFDDRDYLASRQPVNLSKVKIMKTSTTVSFGFDLYIDELLMESVRGMRLTEVLGDAYSDSFLDFSSPTPWGFEIRCYDFAGDLCYYNEDEVYMCFVDAVDEAENIVEYLELLDWDVVECSVFRTDRLETI